MADGAIAVAILTGLALFFASVLAVSYRFLRVDEDPRIVTVEELLPASNCGACGEPGCGWYPASRDGWDAAGVILA